MRTITVSQCRAALALVLLAAAGIGAAGAPVTWSGLLLWPAQPITTLGTPSAWPALAASDKHLVLGEIMGGGVYLSELDPATAKARWTQPLAAAVEGRERTHLQLCLVGPTLWVGWLEAPSGTAPEVARSLVLQGFDLAARTARPTAEVAVTTDFGLAAYNEQLWVGWLGPAESRSLSLSPGSGDAASVVNWQPPVPGRPLYLSLGDCGAGVCLPFVSEDRGQRALWYASYNGHRFLGLRKLRGLGEIGPPAVCRLQTRLLVVYTLFPAANEPGHGGGDLLLTTTDPSGQDLSSQAYLQDGKTNLNPTLVTMENTAYLAFSKWSARPGTAGSTAANLGLYLGKIEPAL